MSKEPIHLVILHAEASRSTFTKIFYDLLKVELGDLISASFVSVYNRTYNEVSETLNQLAPQIIISEWWWNHLPLQDKGMQLARDVSFAAIPRIILSYDEKAVRALQSGAQPSSEADTSAPLIFCDKNQMRTLIKETKKLVIEVGTQQRKLRRLKTSDSPANR